MNASVFGNKITRGKSQPVENTFLDFDLQKKRAKKKLLIAPSGNRTRTPRLGNSDANHYTNDAALLQWQKWLYLQRLKNEYFGIYVPVGIFTE